MQQSKYEVTPWFSCHEWEDVYKYIFGSKAEDWKKAYTQISVWKSRVPVLAVGIESTIPLLHAKMALADHSMEESYKNSILNLAILRFVSIVTKGFENRLILGAAKQNLSFHMNLPQYLITQRNQIVHNDNQLGTSPTLKSALENSLQWIQINYWKEEERHMSKVGNGVPVSEGDVGDDDCVPEAEAEAEAAPVEGDDVEGDSSLKLRASIREYLPHVICTKDPNVVLGAKKKYFLMREELENYFCCSPNDSMKVLVSELFYSSELMKRYSSRKKKGSKCCTICKALLPKYLIWRLSCIIRTVINLHSVNIFINELITVGQDHPALCAEWIQILVTTAYFAPRDQGCRFHRFLMKRRPFELGASIKIEKLLYQLLNLGHQWSSSLALKICENSVWNKELKCKKGALQELSDIYLNRTTEAGRPERSAVDPRPPASEVDPRPPASEVDPTAAAETLLTLGHVMERAKMTSESALAYVEEVCSRVWDAAGSKGKRKARYEGTPLGVLPHQTGDPLFYAQLVLPAAAAAAAAQSPGPVRKKPRSTPTA